MRRVLNSTLRSYSTKTASSVGSQPEILKSLCVANRGEIVHRVCDTASKMGIDTTSFYTEPDGNLPFARSANNNLSLGADTKGYLEMDKIVRLAKENGCDSIHPGYGFLSENSEFAKKVQDAGLIFVGPPAEAMEAMGSKSRSKEIMTAAGVSCVPGYHGENQDPAFLEKESEKMGFPVLIKAVLGGGGKGMRIVETKAEFQKQLASAKSEAKSSFGDERVLVEKYIKRPRHVEVQVFADKFGNVVALGERDCSVQRRHQKVLEESPAPGLELYSADCRDKMYQQACDAARAVKYEGAGTVEFIFDRDSDVGQFYFMEMNTRLQVEHPVTEMVTGVDLVEWQLLIASGRPLPKTQEQVVADMDKLGIHAIEARIYCEDPFNQFMPSSGKIVHMQLPQVGNPRLDVTFQQGDTVSPLYDPMIGKLIVRGDSREEALKKLRLALNEFQIVGPTTNIEFIKRVLKHEGFRGNNPSDLDTGFIPRHGEVLFANEGTPNDVYVQAAIAQAFPKALAAPSILEAANAFSSVGAAGWSAMQTREVVFKNGKESVAVTLTQLPSSSATEHTFAAKVGDQSVGNVTASHHLGKARFRFPTGQHVNTVVSNDSDLGNVNEVHVFHRGTHHKVELATPEWVTAVNKRIGAGSASGGSFNDPDAMEVATPMPCRVVRVTVKPGDIVSKDDELIVIESMKMETTVRSAREQPTKVKRVAFVPGDLVKQGSVLIEYEETK